jgi:hypothetical protein
MNFKSLFQNLVEILKCTFKQSCRFQKSKQLLFLDHLVKMNFFAQKCIFIAAFRKEKENHFLWLTGRSPPFPAHGHGAGDEGETSLGPYHGVNGGNSGRTGWQRSRWSRRQMQSKNVVWRRMERCRAQPEPSPLPLPPNSLPRRTHLGTTKPQRYPACLAKARAGVPPMNRAVMPPSPPSSLCSCSCAFTS